MTLIEVIVSALLVGLVAIATLTGFNSVKRTTADERLHDQGAVLLAESQEQLRSDSAEVLDHIQTPTTHSYTQTVNGETFTVTQYDAWITDNGSTSGCSATGKETTTTNGRYLQITSSVTWPQLTAANRSPLSQTSYITPPDGSGLEVDVTNGGTPLLAVSGATAVANGIELTTGESGCAIFGSLPTTTASVEVKKLGDVTESGAWRKVSKELSVVPNLTTHSPVTLAAAGSITAHFAYQGKEVTGDTFVAANNNIKETPDYELGSTKFEWAETGEKAGAFRALTGNYQLKASTFSTSSFYPNGDLFPFTSAWNVYAGDCPGNEPAKFGATNSTVLVKSTEALVTVPMADVNLEAYQGTKSTPKGLESTAREAKITNVSCASSQPPNNSESTLAIEHSQKTNSTGGLLNPYQPFGKFKLCLYDASTEKTYTTEYTNEGSSPTSIKLYLGTGTGTSEGVTIKSASKNTC